MTTPNAPTDQQLAEWARVCAEGSRGNWRAHTGRNTAAIVADAEGCYVYLNCDAVVGPGSQVRWHADARFIALARTALPALLDLVRGMKVEREKMLPVCEAAARFFLARYHQDADAEAQAWVDVASRAINVLEYAPADFMVTPPTATGGAR